MRTFLSVTEGESTATSPVDTKESISSTDGPPGLPGSQLGAGILSDKSFAALASQVSEASLKVQQELSIHAELFTYLISYR